jgi:GH15 family glucan-1,4-alpha-glucosidase
LSSPDGSIDWWCAPRFDSDPIFGALVGGDAAGSFRLGPADPPTGAQRRYWPDSAVLETTWHRDGASLVLTEAMIPEVGGQLLPRSLLVRRLEARGGQFRAQLRFDPRRGADRATPRVEHRHGTTICSWGGDVVTLATAPRLTVTPGDTVELALGPGDVLTAVVTVAHREPVTLVSPKEGWAQLLAADAWWRQWVASVDVTGMRKPWREATVRSLITLRMLTYAPSGAPVAAVTTSLPEAPGAPRNWDYRYAWPRDASIGIAAFLGVGRDEEARAFLYWLLHAGRLHRPRLPAMLTLHGRAVPAQRDLPGWPGYANSPPVRFGNDARDQHQLDGYGWVVDAAWLLVSHGHRLYAETWRAMSGFADLVADRWNEPDSGIWEVPGPPRHYVHSKLMGWLALDRALRISSTHRTSARRCRRWRAAREALSADIQIRGVDETNTRLTRTYDDEELDAALLILPVLEFLPPTAPLVRNTVAAIEQQLSTTSGLLYRYPPGSDGLPGKEGAFLPCSFWLVQALARTGKQDRAADLFARLLERAGPLGLFAEEVDPGTGRQLGNYPQAFTHATLIQAALALRDVTADPATPRATPRTRHAPPPPPAPSAGRS